MLKKFVLFLKFALNDMRRVIKFLFFVLLVFQNKSKFLGNTYNPIKNVPALCTPTDAVQEDKHSKSCLIGSARALECDLAGVFPGKTLN